MESPTDVESTSGGEERKRHERHAEEVVASFERCMGAHVAVEPERLQTWRRIADHRDWLVERAKEYERFGCRQLADDYRTHVRELDIAIKRGCTERQLRGMLSVERLAKAALINHWRDRPNEDKRRDAVFLLDWIAGRSVDLEEEEQIDLQIRTSTGGNNSFEKRAARIVNRLATR